MSQRHCQMPPAGHTHPGLRARALKPPSPPTLSGSQCLIRTQKKPGSSEAPDAFLCHLLPAPSLIFSKPGVCPSMKGANTSEGWMPRGSAQPGEMAGKAERESKAHASALQKIPKFGQKPKLTASWLGKAQASPHQPVPTGDNFASPRTLGNVWRDSGWLQLRGRYWPLGSGDQGRC